MAWDVSSMTGGIRGGDPAAFDAFYALYSDRMLRYLLVVTRGDDGATQEVHQEALLRVVRHVKPMTSDGELWGYLVSIMRSVWIDRLRSQQRQHTRNQPLDDGTALIAAAEQESQINERLHEALDHSVQSLSAADRRLILDHYIQGQSQAAIAAALNVPLKTVSMRLVRLRRYLHDLMMRKLNHD